MKKRLLIGLLTGVCAMGFANTQSVKEVKLAGQETVVAVSMEEEDGFWCNLVGLGTRVGMLLTTDVRGGELDKVVDAAVKTCEGGGSNDGMQKKPPTEVGSAVTQVAEAE
jgi:hypothetical protein